MEIDRDLEFGWEFRLELLEQFLLLVPESAVLLGARALQQNSIELHGRFGQDAITTYAEEAGITHVGGASSCASARLGSEMRRFTRLHTSMALSRDPIAGTVKT